MLSKKGVSKSTNETLFLAIKLVLALIGLAAIYMYFSGFSLGCSRYNDNPSACIEDGKCKPFDSRDGDGNFQVKCTDSVRTPNHRYNAAEDAECVCPEGWPVVFDEDDKHYGLCKEEGSNNYTTCQYTINPKSPLNREMKCVYNGEIVDTGIIQGSDEECCLPNGKIIKCKNHNGNCRAEGGDCPEWECKDTDDSILDTVCRWREE